MIHLTEPGTPRSMPVVPRFARRLPAGRLHLRLHRAAGPVAGRSAGELAIVSSRASSERVIVVDGRQPSVAREFGATGHDGQRMCTTIQRVTGGTACRLTVPTLAPGCSDATP